MQEALPASCASSSSINLKNSSNAQPASLAASARGLCCACPCLTINTRFGGSRGSGIDLFVSFSTAVFSEIIVACLFGGVVALIASSACCLKADDGNDAVRKLDV